MSKRIDEKLIAEAGREIKRQQEDALTNLSVMLAVPHSFDDAIHWCFCLGKLFALQTEVGGFQSKGVTASYNDENLDKRLPELIAKLSPQDKGNLAAFLLGATQAVTLERIERMAGVL